MQIPYHAYIIGEGKLRTKIEKLIVRYGLNHVKLCGWISNDEVWQYYEKAHVMVMPSEIEGMSISNLEAISAGLYLIATPTSGNPDIIENCKNGELVPFNSAKEIANALQKFYFDKYINKKFTDTQEIKEFCNKFSWQNIVKQYEIYLNKIITQNED
jgi:glycosyltransferase involved in cell wall biosynthesis